MTNKDITKTGPLSYRELQDLNDNSSNIGADFAQAQSMILNSAGPSSVYDAYADAPREVESPYARTSTPYGESWFDEERLNEDEFQHIGDVRAENQPWLAKLGASVLQGTALAGTTFLDGTLGLIYGAGRGLYNLFDDDESTGFWSGLWDNEVSNGLQEVNKFIEQIAPYYRTEESLNKPWWENMGSLDFWADGFLKNMGFTIGALYSGAAWTKLLKAGSLIKDSSTLGAKLTGSLFSAVNEGRIEANQNASTMIKSGTKMLTEGKEDERNRILNDMSTSREQKEVLLADLEYRYDEEVKKLQENARYMGNLDLFANIPILTLDNFLTFGKMYARGFSNARNTAVQNTKKTVSQAANEAMAAEENILRKGITKAEETGKYAWETITNKKAIGKGLLTGLREGNEELAQAMAAEVATNLYAYDSPDAYYKAMTDPTAIKKSMGLYSSLAKGFSDTYGNADRYEEFAIGALTGLLGTPTFGRTMNADANTYLGRGKVIGLSGGLFGELSSAHEQNRRGEENVKWMNRLQDKVKDNVTSLAQSNFFQDAMDGFSKDNNKFEYLNMSDNDTARGIQAFLSAGREEDLLAIIDQPYETMSDEELAKIAGFTTPEMDNKNSIVGWKDANGQSLANTKEGIETLRNKLIKTRDIAKEDIKNFKDSLGLVRRISNNAVNQSESEINELAWLHWKTSKIKQRVHSITKDNREAFTVLSEGLNEYKKQLQERLDVKELEDISTSPETSAAIAITNQQLNKSKREDEAQLRQVNNILSMIGLLNSTSDNNMPNLGMLVGENKEWVEGLLHDESLYNNFLKNKSNFNSFAEYQSFIESIEDLGKLYQAFNDFSDRFNEYTQDPLKQKANRQKIDNNNKKVQEAVDKNSSRNKSKNIPDEGLRQMTVSQIEESISNLDKDVDAEEIARRKELIEAKKIEEVLKDNIQSNPNLTPELKDSVINSMESHIAKGAPIEEFKNPNSVVFLTKANGEPYLEEEQAALQAAADEAVNSLLKTSGYAVNQTSVESVIEDSLSDRNASQIEKQLESEDNKETEEKSPTRTSDKKLSIINNAATWIKNANILQIKEGVTEEELFKACNEVAVSLYNIIEGKDIKNKDDIIRALKADDNYNTLANLLNDSPYINPGIQSILRDLNIKVEPKTFTEESTETHSSQDLKGQNESDYQDDTKVITGAFLRATSEFAFGSYFKKGENKPYYEYVKDPVIKEELKTVYEYLKSKDVFNKQRNIKVKQKIYFTTDPELNQKVGHTVILMSTDPEGKDIIGDLAYDRGDEAPFTSFEKNTYLKEFYSRFTKAFNEWSKNNTGTFVYSHTSEVRQTMHGSPIFTLSNSKTGDRILNDIFMDNGKPLPFDIGIVMSGGVVEISNISTTSGARQAGLKIKKPNAEFTVGTPVVLISSGEGTNLNIPVPFHMDRFNSSMSDSILYKYALELLTATFNKEEYTAVNVKDALREIFSEDIFVNFNGNNLEYHIGTKKENTKSKSTVISREGLSSEALAEKLLESIAAKNSYELRVNRRNLGKEITVGGQKINYNRIIGELAHNNLASNTTKGDFFSIAPLNTKDEIVGVPRIKFPTNPTGTNTTNPSTAATYTSITYNNKEYRVTQQGDIKDKDNKEIELDVTSKAIILAKAEIERNNNATPIYPTSPDWYRLSDGRLLYNKDGEEKILSNEDSIDRQLMMLEASYNASSGFDDGKDFFEEDDSTLEDKDKEGDSSTSEGTISQQPQFSEEAPKTKEEIKARNEEIERGPITIVNDLDNQTKPGVYATVKVDPQDGTKTYKFKVYGYSSKGELKGFTGAGPIISISSDNLKNPEVQLELSDGGFTGDVWNLEGAQLFELRMSKDGKTIGGDVHLRPKDKSEASTVNLSYAFSKNPLEGKISDGTAQSSSIQEGNPQQSQSSEDKNKSTEYITSKISSKPIKYKYNTEELYPVIYIPDSTGGNLQVVWDSDRDRWVALYIDKDGKVLDPIMDMNKTREDIDRVIHNNLSKEFTDFFESGEFKKLNSEDVRNDSNKLDEALKNKFDIKFYKAKLEDYINLKGESLKQPQSPKVPVTEETEPTEEEKTKISKNGIIKVCPVCGKPLEGHEHKCPQCESNLDIFRQIEQLSEEEAKEIHKKFFEPKEEKKEPLNSFCKTKVAKLLFDKLPLETQQEIAAWTSANAKSNLATNLNNFAKNRNIKNEKSPNLKKLTEEDIMKIVNDSKAKYRKELSEEYKSINLDKELEWLKEVLPQLNEEDAIRIQKTLIDIANSPNSEKAYGMVQNGIMTISEMASRGTVYHEAFHVVVNAFLDSSEINTLFDEGAKLYGLDRVDNVDEEIEEFLAEDFRRYVEREQIPLLGRAVKFFRSIKHIVQNWIGNESYINNLFYRINNSEFSKKEYQYSKEIRYNKELQNILDKAPRNSGGKLLAPNGKVSNLSERQYAQVRTKAFKEWFGDWENNPEEASKVIDKNGEPKVMWHGTIRDFTIFDKSAPRRHKVHKTDAIWFTDSKEKASLYGDITLPVFLNIRTPGETSVLETGLVINSKAEEEILSNNKYDGAIITRYDKEGDNRGFTPVTQWVIKTSNQVKSAIDNIGTFSKTNDDIRYRRMNTSNIEEYYNRKFNYTNLNTYQLDSLQEKGITEDQYDLLTTKEKESLFRCML